MMIAIRVRGKVGLRKGIIDTFKMLRMERSHSAVLLPENPIYRRMIKKVKDYTVFGNINDETLKELLKKRLVRKDKAEVSDKLVDKVIKNLKEGKLLKDVEEIKPVIRLHPPRGGFRGKGIKKAFKQGGVLGFRESVDELVKKMM